ncbi:MAG: bifunctional 2-polyprenyl-6-hydroxyphenol methylase/3-demethylubiquinol 3-O-methyltransferase UbiG [Steroidobacteraceae bacterium]|nr:bifunctional 2-polyprenyl-6-hydroxyphenol methylase/3-demethylubiquinol 3-O-methyltransferase UbiG [Steroidobacteraceae bacterium]MDW8260589.1 bifunctional 2-polyprenyl-6-hydroxyphenol methylase/3-demethylubiquinol 3-O-methyltransferase UbiG [Gammaproteobacteria bacterium]
MTERGNHDLAEVGKFAALAHRFWDPRGEFRPLHALNPVRVRYIAERVPLSGARVLDVGCGGGLLAESLARAGARVTGVDLAAGMIEAAQLHALESGLAIEYRCAAAESLLSDAAGTFDLVCCLELIEHVPDPAAMIGTLAALARPGGSVVVSSINRNLRAFLQAIVIGEYVLELLPRGTHAYERLVRPSELARYGRRAGLTLRDVSGLAYNPVTELASLGGDPGVNYIALLERA